VYELAAGRINDGHAVALAVSEAVTNVVIHAYRDRHYGLPGEVYVTATIDGEELLVSVAGERTLADRFARQQRPGGSRLLLGFRLSTVSDRAS
jgi:anti-sigma regulatory factor (Ser/Thr protein kinase)